MQAPGSATHTNFLITSLLLLNVNLSTSIIQVSTKSWPIEDSDKKELPLAGITRDGDDELAVVSELEYFGRNKAILMNRRLHALSTN